MSARKARWALWSVGAITNRVIVEMREADAYEIAAVVSSKKEKAQKFIDDNGLSKATAYDNIDDVLSSPDIDIVYIASPPWLHVEQACKAMDAGKAVLVEKPMANTPAEVKEIFECAKKNNVFCVEGVWTNYFPAMKKVKEWIEAGKIGRPVEVITTFGTVITAFGVDPANPEHWGTRVSSGGGTLMQFGPYNVNLSQYVYGKAPEKILGVTNRIPGDDGADLETVILMSYDDAASHTLMSCSWEAKTMSDSRISGTAGEITIGKPFFCPYDAVLYENKWTNPWCTDLSEEFHDDYAAKGREGFKYQFDAVSQYVVDGLKESPEVPASYSIMLAETLERIRKELGMQ